MDTLSDSTAHLRRRKPAADAPAVEVRNIGPYRLLRRLAAGGMSTVYRGYDDEKRRLVAVKLLAAELLDNPTCVDRFRQEATVGMELDHPNIIRCYGTGWDEGAGKHFLVMEYVAGRTAQQILTEQGPMPVGVAARVALDIARGLQEIHHHNYVHRDVKPGNILIDEDGRAKLGDLGVAKRRDREMDLTSLDTGVGTPFYMPYEQMMNSSVVDERTDLFALGVTLYQLLTGRLPFPGRNFEEVFRRKEEGVFRSAASWAPGLPPIADVIIGRMLDRNPHQRYRDAGHFIEIILASGLLDKDAQARDAEDGEKSDDEVATKRDMALPTEPPRPAKNAAPAWTIEYRAQDGRHMRMHARVATVERYCDEGRLPSHFLVLHKGEMKPFRAVPEFQHLADHPPPEWETAEDAEPAPARKRRYWKWAVIGAVSLTATAFFHFFLQSLSTTP